MSHTIAGARGAVRSPAAILREAQTWAAARGGEVLLADASVVFGHEHLESAALHAVRARDANQMTTRSVGMEALLYLAAQRQVADAIRIAGIKASTSTVAVILFGGSAVDQLIALLGWSRDDGVLDARGKDLSVLGVRKLERGTVPEDRLVDLALERTALLDVLK